ncbi:hypothetical protein HGRIS_006538 [Hohenbuehelia grisea]|uniref:Uncharacterized protein n=1 Tax=Hohenbuehelia grisea TaxID=104357 RepID=A0ABR3J981_9AGAR
MLESQRTTGRQGKKDPDEARAKPYSKEELRACDEDLLAYTILIDVDRAHPAATEIGDLWETATDNLEANVSDNPLVNATDNLSAI